MNPTRSDDPLAIETRETTARLLGLSLKTLDSETDIPRVRLSPRRWGYRRCDIAKWQEERLEYGPVRGRRTHAHEAKGDAASVPDAIESASAE